METKQKREKGNAAFVNLPKLRYTIWKRSTILHKPTASVQLSERRQYLPFIHHSTLVLTGFKGRELTPLSRCEFSFWSTGVQLSERHPYLPSIPYLSPLKHPINIVLKSFRGRWGSQLSPNYAKRHADLFYKPTSVQLSERRPYLPSIFVSSLQTSQHSGIEGGLKRRGRASIGSLLCLNLFMSLERSICFYFRSGSSRTLLP